MTWPLSSVIRPSMPAARAIAASRMRTKGRSARFTCGTSKLSVTSRIADWSGSSESAACVSKARPGPAAGRLCWPAAPYHGDNTWHKRLARGILLHIAGLQAALRARSVKLSWASCSLANWSSSRARLTSSIVGEFRCAVDRVGKGLRLHRQIRSTGSR